MRKIFIVDDEEIILEGISNMMDWETISAELTGTARSGAEALSKMKDDPPDIVITDVKMPEMDGLQLVAEAARRFPSVRFIVISGFNEFEYAKTAMSFGVKHYLLKPCKKEHLLKALRELMEELGRQEKREQFTQGMKKRLEKVLPYVKEQFLKEFVTNKTYGKRDWEYYRHYFNLNFENTSVRMLLIKLEGDYDFEHMFAVKNIAEDILGIPLLSSSIGDHVLILLEDADEERVIYEKLETIRKMFFQYYAIDCTMALSEIDDISNVKKLYKETLECLNHRFYLGEGSLITRRDIAFSDQCEKKEFAYDEDRLCMYVKSGRWEDAKKEIDEFFSLLAEMRLEDHIAKSYVIQLFITVVRLRGSSHMDAYMNKISRLFQTDTLQTINAIFLQVAKEITLYFYERNKDRHSAIIQKAIDLIHEHLGNPELSLNWVAEQLYINADYLSKLFKKKTGENFSNYVMKCRIDKSAELIEKQDMKIFELAERMGFGDNPQYFSQVFKKYRGCTPTEYKNLFSRL